MLLKALGCVLGTVSGSLVGLEYSRGFRFIGTAGSKIVAKQSQIKGCSFLIDNNSVNRTSGIKPSTVYNVHEFFEEDFLLNDLLCVKEDGEKMHIQGIESTVDKTSLASLFFTPEISKGIIIDKKACLFVSYPDYYSEEQAKEVRQVFSNLKATVNVIPESTCFLVERGSLPCIRSGNYCVLNLNGKRAVFTVFSLKKEKEENTSNISIEVLERKVLDGFITSKDVESIIAGEVKNLIKEKRIQTAGKDDILCLPYEGKKERTLDHKYWCNISGIVSKVQSRLLSEFSKDRKEIEQLFGTSYTESPGIAVYSMSEEEKKVLDITGLEIQFDPIRKMIEEKTKEKFKVHEPATIAEFFKGLTEHELFEIYILTPCKFLKYLIYYSFGDSKDITEKVSNAPTENSIFTGAYIANNQANQANQANQTTISIKDNGMYALSRGFPVRAYSQIVDELKKKTEAVVLADKEIGECPEKADLEKLCAEFRESSKDMKASEEFIRRYNEVVKAAEAERNKKVMFEQETKSLKSTIEAAKKEIVELKKEAESCGLERGDLVEKVNKNIEGAQSFIDTLDIAQLPDTRPITKASIQLSASLASYRALIKKKKDENAPKEDADKKEVASSETPKTTEEFTFDPSDAKSFADILKKMKEKMGGKSDAGSDETKVSEEVPVPEEEAGSEKEADKREAL